MSYTLNKTGAQIDVILDRAAQGGQIDQDIAAEQARAEAAEALKAPLASPALTGTPTAPTPEEGDNSTKIATTAFVQSAAAEAVAAEQARAEAAEEALQNAIDNAYITDTAGPAAILTIPDGADNIPVKSLTANIEPIQDLHGYSSPWPAGGGKNKIPMTVDGIKAVNTGGTWSGNAYTLNGVTFTIQTNASGAVTGIKANGTASANTQLQLATNIGLADGSYIVNGGLSNNLRVFFYDGTNYYNSLGGDTAFTLNSPTQQVVTIVVVSGTNPNNAVFQPMVRLSSVADATFAPYSNICPISGWTGASGRVTGKNLVNWNVNTTASALSIALKPETYTISAQSTLANGNWYIRFTKTDGSFISDGSLVGLTGWAYASSGWLYGAASGQTVTFTVPSGVALVEIGKLNADGTIPAQLEVGSTATTYEAYNGTTYPVSWTDEAGTVYSGYFVVNSDGSVDLTVTHRVITISASTSIEFAASAQYGARGKFNVPGMEVVTDAYRVYAISEVAEGVSYNDRVADVEKWRVYGENGNAQITLRAPASANIQNAADLLAPFVNTKIIYPLATSQSYQIDPVTVRTLLGVNNVWTDTGETEMEYRADTALYIQKKLAVLG